MSSSSTLPVCSLHLAPLFSLESFGLLKSKLKTKQTPWKAFKDTTKKRNCKIQQNQIFSYVLPSVSFIFHVFCGKMSSSSRLPVCFLHLALLSFKIVWIIQKRIKTALFPYISHLLSLFCFIFWKMQSKQVENTRHYRGRALSFFLFRASSQTLPRLFLDSSSTVPQLFLDCSSTVPRLFLDSSSTVPRLFLDSASTLPRLFPDCSSTLPRLFLDSSSALPRLFLDSSSALPWLFLHPALALPRLFFVSLDVLTAFLLDFCAFPIRFSNIVRGCKYLCPSWHRFLRACVFPLFFVEFPAFKFDFDNFQRLSLFSCRSWGFFGLFFPFLSFSKGCL